MFHPRSRLGLAWFAVLVAACSGGSTPAPAARDTPATPAPVSITERVLVDAEAFDLAIPADFFQRDGRALAQNPNIASCHMQGLSIAGDQLVLSCVLFNHDEPKTRTRVGKSFVLATRLCDVVPCGDAAPSGNPAWRIHDITAPIPPADSRRLTEQLLERTELTAEEAAIQHLLSHPSGLFHDAERGAVWLANAGYAPRSYAHVMEIAPPRIGDSGQALAEQTIPVPYHLGAVAVLGGRYLVGLTWASQEFAIVDVTGAAAPVLVPNPLSGTPDQVDIQDCDVWDDLLLCSGVYEFKAAVEAPDVPLSKQALEDEAVNKAAIRVRKGRVQILRLDTSRHPQVKIELVGYLRAKLGSGAPSIDLGVQRYRYDDNDERVQLVHNDYGGFQTELALAYEGMAIGPQRRYIYFVPADLPASKLIRMRLATPE